MLVFLRLPHGFGWVEPSPRAPSHRPIRTSGTGSIFHPEILRENESRTIARPDRNHPVHTESSIPMESTATRWNHLGTQAGGNLPGMLSIGVISTIESGLNLHFCIILLKIGPGCRCPTTRGTNHQNRRAGIGVSARSPAPKGPQDRGPPAGGTLSFNHHRTNSSTRETVLPDIPRTNLVQ